jgi:hypothetical protein
MAITNCVIIGRSGKEELTGGKRVKTFQSVWKLKSNTRNEDPATVLAYPALPLLASTWPTDGTCFCVGRTPSQNQSMADEWTVSLDYTNSPSLRENPDEYVENPLLRPPTISRSPQQRQRIAIRDAYGVLMVNTAGELPNEPIEVESHSPGFTITKNLPVWPFALEVALQDSINLTAISIPYWGVVIGPKLSKFNGFSGSPRWENGFRFWEVSCSIETDWEGWNKPYVSAGYNEKVEDPGDPGNYFLWPIIGANGERPADPVLLDENGVSDPYRSSPYLIETYRKYREVNHLPLYQLMGLTP